MKFRIMHENKNRIRIRAELRHMSLREADALEIYIASLKGVTKAKVYDRTMDAVVEYSGDREELASALAVFCFNEEVLSLVPRHSSRMLNREYEDKLIIAVAKRLIMTFFLPSIIKKILTSLRSAIYIYRGLCCLIKGKIEVPVLDAAAISVSLLRSDFGTAASIMFLLGTGGLLEEWTHKKSIEDLAGAMSIGGEKVWLITDDGEMAADVSEVRAGDRILVRTGNLIPLDGRVVSGDMTVNQASLTGEAVAVNKHEGSLVYAGTAVEAGECVVEVEKISGSGRYDRIVRMIEESEKLKSATEDRASHLADKLVPYSLISTLLMYLATGDVAKALAILMVDYSCALKLSMPVAVLSTMREGSKQGISFKGGKFIEAVSEADTLVFDKTGTLTYAAPKVHAVVPFGDMAEEEILRIAACLEEHYPHSIANAVVREAADRGIRHDECHSSVEYIVAHGILGVVEKKRVVIGSHHYVFDDERCLIRDMDRFSSLPDEYSHLYMAVDGELEAVILIEDPIKSEAEEAIRELHLAGFKKIIMMTGDNERTAKAIAKKAGIDEYYSEVLPEDKAAYIRKLRENGSRVVMVGDGVNDAPALSEADAGIAVNSGAALAREISDITITEDNLCSLVVMKRLADLMMKRIDHSYKFIISFNTVLIVLGVAGTLTPSTTAFLHNASTLGIGLNNMTNLLRGAPEKAPTGKNQKVESQADRLEQMG